MIADHRGALRKNAVASGIVQETGEGEVLLDGLIVDRNDMDVE